jgi:mannose-6-phosphate isomerase-like protein (cupin superfamily)
MPSIEQLNPRSQIREWGIETFIVECPAYLGKLLHMKPGTKGGLQFHVEKDEAFYLLSGEALVRTDDGDGLRTIRLEQGQGFRIPPGAIHQVEAVTDCILIEWSTPHYDDRVHVESRYGLPEAGGLPTTHVVTSTVHFIR